MRIVVKATLSLLVSRGIGLAIQFLNFVLLARSVAPETLGVIAFYTAFFMIVGAVSDSGASVLLPVSVTNNRVEDTRKILDVQSGFFILGCSLCLVGLLTCTWFQIPSWVPVLGIWAATEFACELLMTVSFGRFEYKSSQYSVLFRRGGTLILYLLVSTITSYVVSYAVSQAVSGAFAVLLLVHRHRSLVRLVRPTLSPKQLAQYFRIVRPVLLTQYLTALRNLDVLILFLVSGKLALAAYSVAAKFVMPIQIAYSSFGSIALPHAATAGGRKLSFFYLRILYVSLAIGIFVFLLRSPLSLAYSYIVGSNYSNQFQIVWLALLLAPIVFSTLPFTAISLGRGDTSTAQKASALFTGVLLVLGSAFGYIFGAGGMLFAVAVAALVKVGMLLFSKPCMESALQSD